MVRPARELGAACTPMARGTISTSQTTTSGMCISTRARCKAVVPVADVLLEFYDVLLSMPRNFRLVTYHMESAASLVSHEMLRCGLHFARQNFERIVRAQGHCLMDPSIHGGIQSSPPSYPTLEELAVVVLPDEERALRGFLPGGDECLLYLRLARGLREATLPECRRTGHVPVRSMMRLAMRDNGYNQCSSSSLPKVFAALNS